MVSVISWEEAFALVLCYLMDAFSVRWFCGKYFDCAKEKERLFMGSCFGGAILLNILNRYLAISYIFKAAMRHLLLLALIVWLFCGNGKKKILAASLLITIRTLVWTFCQSFLCVLTLVFLHTVKKVEEPFIGVRGEYVIAFLAFGAGAAAVAVLAGHLWSVFADKTENWYLVLAFPMLAVALLVEVALWGASNGIMVTGGMGWNVYDNQLFSHAGIGALSVLAMAAVCFYLFGMDKIYTEQRTREQYQAQVSFYKMLEGQYRQMERLRHDMKNHLIGLQGLLKNREWEKADAYLCRMMEEGKLAEVVEATGSKAVDALLFQKRTAAKKAGIDWECQVMTPAPGNVDEFDLCVVFGNLLDNALKACMELEGDRDKFIHIQAGKVKRCYLIEAANSALADRNGKGGSQGRQMANVAGHGIGLLNVGDVVKKYEGVMHKEQENGVFRISILLPLLQ